MPPTPQVWPLRTLSSSPPPESTHNSRPAANARIATIRAKCGNETQLALSQDWPMQKLRRTGKREIDQGAYFDDVIPPEHTKGHTIWVAGDRQRPWFWCPKCEAYTNKNVRNINQACKGNGNLFVTKQLNEGYEPPARIIVARLMRTSSTPTS